MRTRLVIVFVITFFSAVTAQLSPQALPLMQPTELEGLENLATFGGLAPLSQPVDNGLPPVSVNDAVGEFIARQQAIAQQQDEADADGAAEPALEEEDDENGSQNLKKTSAGWDGRPGLHAAVPRLQQWLTAMDPMSYAAPTYTNPVAQQVIGKLKDPRVSVARKEQLGRLVSSPYMWHMLGNPAFADPQLWTGLVSGAAVPYPVRTTILAQRTKLPFQLAHTGSVLTPTDQYAMQQYNAASADSPDGDMNPHHKVRHSLFQIIQKLQNKQRSDTMMILPRGTTDVLRPFKPRGVANAPVVARSRKRREAAKEAKFGAKRV